MYKTATFSASFSRRSVKLARFTNTDSFFDSFIPIRNRNHFFGAKYPDDYYGTLRVNKFERSYNTNLNYEFLGAFPINISSMPLSYESPNVLKCVVQFSYIRYNINQVPGGESYQEDSSQPLNIPELKWTSNLDLFGDYEDLISEYGQPYQKEINYDPGIDLRTSDTNFFDQP